MEERQDKQQDIQDRDQIKKHFIREQLKPQRYKTAMRLLRWGMLVLCAAILFGGISAISFYIMRVYFPWEELDENIVVAPARATSSQPADERTVTQEIAPDLLASLEGYEKFSAQLAQVGDSANAAVVRLGSYDMTKSIVPYSPEYKYCGILFHETEKSYYILTEYVVAQKENNLGLVIAEFYHGKAVEAKVCGYSEELNLGILIVDKSQLTQKEQQDIVIAELGDDAGLQLGSAVLAVGKPNGRFYSVNTGLITNAGIPVSIQDQELRMYTMNLAYQEGRMGFVLNVQGQLVGMLSSKYKGDTGEIDTAFFSLSNLESDLNSMIRGQKTPYLGIYGISVGTESAENFHSGNNVSAAYLGTSGISGIYIEQVTSRSPAYKGGMRVADVITEVDGQPMNTMEELHEYIAACKSGQEITILVDRGGDSQRISKKLKVTLK
ncbi:MAG: S1C family serine protease [Lachnospiraceae bacterium]|nr:S1C family serine protease [Lachnospiraceae bacterium]